MTTYKHKRISNGWLVFGLLLGAAGLAIGTFGDLPLDQMIYDPFNVWARILAACGPAPAFWGIGAAGLLTLDIWKGKKTMTLGWLFAFATNVIGPVYMAQSINEELGLTWWMCWLSGLLIFLLPALLFWYLMRKADRKDKIRAIWILLIVCGGSTAVIQVVKRIWFRPRYFALLENPELTFRTWYDFGKSGVSQFMALYETNHDLFRSFPSAHVASAACLFVWAIIPCFTKRGSVSLAMIVAYLGSLAVMGSRMVRGAHFLSDISVGFLITFVLFCICAWAFGLTRYDDSQYEYEDEDDFEERTSRPSKSSRSRKAARHDDFDEEEAEDEDVDFEEDFEPRPRKKANAEKVPAENEESEASEETPAASASDPAKAPASSKDDRKAKAEEPDAPGEHRRLSRRERSAHRRKTVEELFDDSIFED